MSNDELNQMNAKMMLDLMTDKPRSDDRLFKPLPIIEDNPDNTRVEYSQIQHLLTGEVYRASTVWHPESVTRLLRVGNFI